MERKRKIAKSIHKNMMSRCYNKSRSNYKYYGGKGITVCERWHDFNQFFEDVLYRLPNGHLLFREGYQLDKDLKGGMEYSLENCSVITRKKNELLKLQKQRRTIMATKNGKRRQFVSIAKASRELDIPRSTLNKYLKNGKVHSSGYRFRYL